MVMRVGQLSVLIGLFAALVGVLNILADGTAPKLAVRSQIKVGTVLAAREPYRDSPFIVDHFFEDGGRVDLFEGDDASRSLDGDAERSYRVFLGGPATLTLKIHMPRMDRLPRVFLYNDANQLVDGGAVELGDGWITKTFVVDGSGLFRVQARFSYAGVARIALLVRVDEPVETYAAYLAHSMKSIELEFLPTQWNRLEEIRMTRKDAEAIPNVRWQPHPQSRERVQVRIRSANGPWALATLGLAGRNLAHHSTGLLPSLDVRVVSGSLPYGLQRFKLYGLGSKNSGRDMVFESVLRDYGVLMPRADILKVSVGGESQYMELLEGMKPYLFEYAQRSEGPIVGFNADVLIGESNSRFENKEFYKKAHQLDAATYGSVASAPFAEAIDENQMALVHAFALSWGGKHGLGQADFRFHVNSRTSRIAPMVRDFNSTTAGDPYFDPVNAFRDTLVELADYAPDWRPNVVTHGSYFVERTESGTELDEFYWWTTHPASLQFFAKPRSFGLLARHMELLQSPLAVEQTASRHNNIKKIARLLDDGRLGNTLDIGPAQRRFKDFENANVAFRLDDSITDDLRYLRDLIAEVSDGEAVPSEASLKQIVWRNASVLRMHEQATEGLRSERVALWHEMRDAPDDVVTYLHGTETHDRTLLTFVQRNPRTGEGTFALVDPSGRVYQPVRETVAGAKAFPLKYRDLYLSNIREDERVRLYFFSIPKDAEFRNLNPRVTGRLRYLGPRNISLNPAYPLPTGTAELVRPDEIFDVRGNVYRLRADAPAIESGLEIPRDVVLRIDGDREMRFGEAGYLIVRGSIRIEYNASLTLTSARDSWLGVHFHNNPDLELRNIVVRNVGDGGEFVVCDGHPYTGGISFYDTRVRLHNVRVENARVEDAIHFLRCEAEADGLTIEDSMSDAIDADFSVLKLTNVVIRNAGGDGVDVSGSLLEIDGARIGSSADKNVSAGENSIVHIRHALLSDGTYGVAVKDGSRVCLLDSTIERNRYGVSSYAKKPVFGKPEIVIGSGVRIRDNGRNIVAYDPTIVQE